MKTDQEKCANEILDYITAINIDGDKPNKFDVLCVIQKYFPPVQPINEKERAKGRTEGYWGMSSEEQWAEDKRNGILDWDGN